MDSHTQQQLTEDLKATSTSDEQSAVGASSSFMDGDLDVSNPTMNPAQVLRLQRTIGNQATAQLLQRTPKKTSAFSNLKMATPDSKLRQPISRKPNKVIQREENEDEQIVRSNAMYEVNEEDYDEDLDESVEDQQITRSDGMLDENDEDEQITRSDAMLDENEDNKDPDWNPHDVKTEMAKTGLKMGRKGYAMSNKVKFIKKVSDGTDDGNIAPGTVMEMFEFGLSEGWALGKLIMAIKKLKSGIKRRGALKEAAKSGGVIGDNKYKSPYKDPAITKDDVESNQLAEAAWYGFSKVKRLVWMLILKIALKLIKIVAHIITLISGGTSSIVTESLALAASSASALRTLVTSAKGIYKHFKGTRGVNRAKNADTMVDLAKTGNVDAAALIIKMNPFDGFSDKAKKWFKKKAGFNSTKFEKPDSPEEFIKQLQDQKIYTPELMKELRKGVSNKMKST